MNVLYASKPSTDDKQRSSVVRSARGDFVAWFRVLFMTACGPEAKPRPPAHQFQATKNDDLSHKFGVTARSGMRA